MVDGCDDPGQSQPQEDVDRVAARHVTDGVVCCLLIDGSDLAGEGVRQRGAQGNECDGRDLKIMRGCSEKLDLMSLLSCPTSSFSPTRQPNMPARSPTTITMSPIMARETKKQG